MFLDPTPIKRACVGFLLLIASVATHGAPSVAPLPASEPHAARSSSPTDVDLAATDASPARFIARKEPVEQLFKAIGSEIHKATRLSSKARQYRISGEFDLRRPFELIERVTSSLGLIWYFDGQIIYVYDNSEVASAMLSVSSETVDSLVSSLKKSALYDHRFPIKHAVGTDLVYVSGPPKYVEVVQAAASLLHTQTEVTRRTERHIELIRIRHVPVGDRNYSQRGVQSSVAGLAQVLAAVLGRGASVTVMPPKDPGTRSPGDGSKDAALPLPPGVSEMPPFDVNTPVTLAPRGTTTATGQLAQEPAGSVNAATEDAAPMNIVAYPSSNSLLLEGTGQQLATARRLIDQLDVAKDQVELSLWVIDIQKNNLDELGVNWSANGSIGPVNVGFNTAATLSRSQAMQFMASVTALSQQKKARIVSRPILLAQDNSPAVFDNSKTFLVRVRGERVAALEKFTYGTMISVTPHVVSPDGRIEMELTIEDGNSDAPSKGSGLDLPVVSSTKISTVARVQHEQSLLVGGYTQSHNTEGVEKIPLLGDIPVLGRLFQFRNTNDQQSVRIFLIQPRMLVEDARFERERVRTPVDITDAVDALKAQVEYSRG
ncbi:EscC/YscC/HrcC family type III secretion system outer membrane ring protein [Pandoraea fibrosis]|uniref:EscC/YscC/HrcC family type III secretion system outer membrane ring protein n=1 Tax=Pandoraea fibrosis TaxID=1891094 RepID=A0ABX6HUP4_9BURK|nr:type III secretion system outer membrane ring subunit SctC [Pandoraea fibrosis]QHE91850.1 EscC/YscC/HrcC family type III secretion system outer membrane ring protein [Pandoraea fibrosis]QHF14593.1 EscC/YscC/HrcC family type III secretion system outer membrane ring protein [Pandoraea fibrosis]